jgi:predicted phage terminase large subunit-like protein
MPTIIGVGDFASTTATIQAKFGGYSATIATLLSGIRRTRKLLWQSPSTCDFVLDKVEEVIPDGYEDVFDLQIDQTENFIANGLVSHNTRWNEDDLIGRHIDPQNSYYNEEEAQSWKIINLPALAEDDDPLGRAIDEPLWSARFDTKFLLDQRRSDPRGFTALYQGRPAPTEGAFFKADFIRTYNKMSELPHADAMRYYGASDFAVATTQENDKSCHMIVGVDENDNIWIMPDLIWSRMPSDMSINAIIALMAKYRPMLWWGEKGVISKSIGPFLRKRMLEKRVFCSIDEIAPIADKLARAQSINARMSMGRVYFPRFARWFSDARDQILKFPHSGFDDFVDTLSLIGLGLMKQIPARGKPKAAPAGPQMFTLGWVKENTKRAQREARLDGW